MSDDDMALACKHCAYRFPIHITVGVMAAHFETEHDTTEVELELVVVCPRCDRVMAFEHSIGNKDHFACSSCHRVRVITRTEQP